MTRGTAGVLAVTSLVLDYDDGTSPEEALHPWLPWPVLASSTWSHAAGHPRFRIVVPLEAPVPGGLWKEAWGAAVARAAGKPDEACSDPGRIYILPALKSAQHPYFRFVHDPGGRLLRLDFEALPARREAAVPGFATTTTSLNPAPRRPGSPRLRRARALLKTELLARERAADLLGARRINGRAEGISCPSCGRESVWFYLAPGAQTTARCDHRGSCSWWGHLDQLLDGQRFP